MHTTITSENETAPDITDIADQLDGLTSDLLDLNGRHDSLEHEVENSLVNLWNNHDELEAKLQELTDKYTNLSYVVGEILGHMLDNGTIVNENERQHIFDLLTELNDEA